MCEVFIGDESARSQWPPQVKPLLGMMAIGLF